MPEGGQDLARPPITIWRKAAGARLTELLAGANLYSMGAGGFAKVPALPQLVRLRQPANVNSAAAVRDSQIYTQQALTKRYG